MKYTAIIIMLLPTLLCAQEFQFRQEFDTIPVEINGWHPHQPWAGGLYESNPDFVDLDADGDLDLVIGSGYPILYFENTGNGASPAYSYSSVTLGNLMTIGGSAPALCDIDNDGDYDLFATSDERVWFWENIGTAQAPQFQFITDSLEQINWWAMGIDLIDIDADNDYDLFTGTGIGTIRFYRNIGTPENFFFQPEQYFFENINVEDDSDPCFCDIDADGDYDFFIGNKLGHIYFYRNDGDSINYNFTFVTDFYNNIDVGGYASPEFADIDGDGDYDLFVGRQQTSTTTDPGDIFFYENIGTPQVAQWNLVTKNYLSLDMGYTARAAMTDIDADSDQDLFIQHAGDRIGHYQNVGSSDSAFFEWITDSYQDIAVDDAFPKFCDIDADGDPDLFLGAAAIPGPPGLHLFQNHGIPQNAQFSLYSSNYLPGVFTQSSVWLAPSLVDFDGDTDQDIFICDTDTFYLFPNVGTPAEPQFGSAIYGWQNLQQTWGQASGWHDIDQDGDFDFFWASMNAWNSLWFYRNVGNAQNPQLSLESQNFMAMGGLHVFSGIDILDIDQDADGDFFLSTSDGGGLLFFRNITGEAAGSAAGAAAPQSGSANQPGAQSGKSHHSYQLQAASSKPIKFRSLRHIRPEVGGAGIGLSSAGGVSVCVGCG